MTRFTCPDDAVYGILMTKEKRQQMFGKGPAASNKMEVYQRNMIEKGTGYKCVKTNMRINTRTIKFVEIPHPNKLDDGFDYTEDFDGYQKIDGKNIFLNLKNIVDQGGAQTRTLREVYHFIEGQLQVLRKLNKEILFANIMDGTCPPKYWDKYFYLLDLYPDVKRNVFVGSLKGYFEWLSAKLPGKPNQTGSSS